MKIAPRSWRRCCASTRRSPTWPSSGLADPQVQGEQIVTAPSSCPSEGEDVELPEIREYLRGLGVAAYKEPRRLVVVEALPRNPLGKVLKRDLRVGDPASNA